MIRKNPNVNTKQLKKTLDTLIEECPEVVAHIFSGKDAILKIKLVEPEQPFIVGVIEPDEYVRAVIRNSYSTFILDALKKEREDYYNTLGYKDMKEFIQDQNRRLEKGILFSAVFAGSNVRNGDTKRIITMNKAVATHFNEYGGIRLFTLKDIERAIQHLTEVKFRNREPLRLLLTSHQDYSIMGDAGTEFFGNIHIKRDSMFNPKYIPKESIDHYLTEGDLQKFISDVVIFNVVCSTQSLDHPMKLGLLERLIQANPSALYIVMVNSCQYDQMMNKDGKYRTQYLRLQKMVDDQELFRLFRLTGGKSQLSRTGKGEYETYFNALWQDHQSHIIPLWDRLSKARPIGIAPMRPITPIKGAKEKDIADLTHLVYCEVAPFFDTKKHTTIKIGGTADAVVYPNTVEDIQKIIKFCNNKNISYWVLGNGSDLVLAEKVPGIVILTLGMYDYTIDDGEATITAQCGAPMFGNYGLVKQAYRHSLSGFEYAVNIPARVGGLVAANASYRMVTGEEMSTADVVKLVRALDPNGDKVELKQNELDFTYKDSRFQKEYQNWIIYEVIFQLTKKNQAEIRERTRQIGFDRFVRKHQPRYTKYPSAGSAYRLRAPYIVGGATYTAAELISGAGCLKFNERNNPLKLHERCPNFIINTGNATFSDVKKLMTDIDFAVHGTYGVHLIPEIQVKPNQPIVEGVSLDQLRYQK